MAAFDINKASADEIHSHVKMIGKDRAEKIVQYRNEHGPFKSLDDLHNVPGFSKGMVEELKRAGVNLGGKKAA